MGRRLRSLIAGAGQGIMAAAQDVQRLNLNLSLSTQREKWDRERLRLQSEHESRRAEVTLEGRAEEGRLTRQASAEEKRLDRELKREEIEAKTTEGGGGKHLVTGLKATGSRLSALEKKRNTQLETGRPSEEIEATEAEIRHELGEYRKVEAVVRGKLGFPQRGDPYTAPQEEEEEVPERPSWLNRLFGLFGDGEGSEEVAGPPGAAPTLTLPDKFKEHALKGEGGPTPSSGTAAISRIPRPKGKPSDILKQIRGLTGTIDRTLNTANPETTRMLQEDREALIEAYLSAGGTQEEVDRALGGALKKKGSSPLTDNLQELGGLLSPREAGAADLPRLEGGPPPSSDLPSLEKVKALFHHASNSTPAIKGDTQYEDLIRTISKASPSEVDALYQELIVGPQERGRAEVRQPLIAQSQPAQGSSRPPSQLVALLHLERNSTGLVPAPRTLMKMAPGEIDRLYQKHITRAKGGGPGITPGGIQELREDVAQVPRPEAGGAPQPGAIPTKPPIGSPPPGGEALASIIDQRNALRHAERNSTGVLPSAREIQEASPAEVRRLYRSAILEKPDIKSYTVPLDFKGSGFEYIEFLKEQAIAAAKAGVTRSTGLPPGSPAEIGFGKEFRALLTRDEGPVYEIYEDSRGGKSFGIGHLVTEADPEWGWPVGRKVSKARVDSAFELDVASHLQDAKKAFPKFDSFPRNVQLVIASMSFNLGAGRIKEFVRFKKSVNAGKLRYSDAAEEMFDSDWYWQIRNRGFRLTDSLNSEGAQGAQRERVDRMNRFGRKLNKDLSARIKKRGKDLTPREKAIWVHDSRVLASKEFKLEMPLPLKGTR